MSWFLSERRPHATQPDTLLLWLFGILILGGLFVLSTASAHLGSSQFGDSAFFLKRQLLQGLLLGGISFFILSRIPYQLLNRRIITLGLLGFAIALMLAVFTPLGMTLNGATRWIEIAGFSFQPAELLKPALIIYLAGWLAFKDHRQKNVWSGLMPFAIILAMVSSVLLLQRSTTPAIILMVTALVMYFASGARIKYILAVIAGGIGLIAVVILVTPYRAQRIASFIEPNHDAAGGNYQIMQAKNAFGSGGITGLGYGNGLVKLRLPEPAGDSVFAVIGEEFGLIGTLFFVGLFCALVVRLCLLASRISDPFGRLIMIGTAAIIGIQAIINMAALTGLIPLTGTPLPFVSYGGTALAIFMAMMGVVVSVSRSVK